MKKITLREAELIRIKNGADGSNILTEEEIAAVRNTETLKDTAQKHSGRVLNDLLRNSSRGDTQAAKEILARGHGAVPQSLELTGEFTIKALHAHVLAPALAEPIEPTSVSSPLLSARPDAI